MRVCGDGVMDPGEECDGMDFGGATCQSLGFGAGTLMCDASCHVVVSGCTPAPNCLDPSQSCLDPACVGQPGCVDSCMPALSVDASGFVSGDTTNRPETHRASCSSATPGPDEIFQLTSPGSGTLHLSVTGTSTAFTLSVRTACADDTSEIGCSDKGSGPFGGVSLDVSVVGGQTYYIMVQGNTTADQGTYFLNIMVPLPETQCDDLDDNDANGYTDCNDPYCQATSEDCVPGTAASGQPCTLNTDCAASHQNPVCLAADYFQQFPNGYCSEFCDMAAPDCSAGDVCYAGLVSAQEGVCLHGCTMDSDCRTADGYACVDMGLSGKVCMLGPETNCNDYLDNDFDNLVDCQDPTSCQTLPACTPGSNAIGQPCTQHNQCVASAGTNNPYCLDEAHTFHTNGYCSHYCDPTNPNDCGANGICVTLGLEPIYYCMQTCSSDADCRTADGYTCQDYGFPEMICNY